MANNTANKSKRPADSAFKQQRLPAWQPVLSPKWVIPTFFVVGMIFIPIGAIILWLSSTVVEAGIEYHNKCDMVVANGSTSGARECFISKLRLDVPKEMKKPVYMYYKLDGFYQNHRRYAQSRNDAQLAGQSPGYKSIEDCKPLRWVGDMEGIALTPEEQKSGATIYNPCGLIAWSMFNDTFVLYDDLGNVICNGTNPDGTICTKKGIAWASDVGKKFKRPVNSPNLMYPQYYHNEASHQIPDTEDEDFMVWMRTAALPNFRKLYRIINRDLPAGSYYLDIKQNFPVSDFGGAKSVVLSTTSWIGGKNMFMGIAYIVVGGVCVILAFLFTIKAIISRKRY